MPDDPELTAETQAWLRKALEDLRAAELLLQANSLLSSQVAFHAQQAAEKSLKAFLLWNSCPFGKTHNLLSLGKACVEIDETLEDVSSRVAPISGYAVEPRYPADFADPSVDEAGQALRLARELFEAVLARLPAETKP
jgi:HEPN domain-containing protein